MANTRILWADDEIELLRPHIMFLEQKGYEVETANNGSDAVEMVRNGHFDIVFLDEQMPGISGVEALEKIIHSFCVTFHVNHCASSIICRNAFTFVLP